LLSVLGDENQTGFYVSMPSTDLEEERQKQIEKLIPSSDAKVFRTSTGFVVRDVHDPDWCKFIGFDDLDRIHTKAICQLLEPACIEAMNEMPLPSLVPLSSQDHDEMEKEFNKICKEIENQKNEQFLIETIDATEVKNYTFEDRLTEKDVIAHQFGPLTPFLQDYLENDFEIEEDANAHIPSLSGLSSYENFLTSPSEASPLSYQKTILKDDPLQSEDFEKGNIAESLICSAMSENENEIDDDLLPSSISPSIFEKEIVKRRSNLKKKKPKISVPIEDEKMKLPPGHEQESFKDEWDFISQNIPPYFLIRSVVVFITFLVMILGLIMEVPVLIMVAAFSAFSRYGHSLFIDIKRIVKTIIKNAFQNRKNRATIKPYIRASYKTQIESLNAMPELKNIPKACPLQNMSILRHEGVAAFNKKVRRLCRIEPVKISETRIIKLNDNRPYVVTRFVNDITRYALLDSGATCSAIHPRFLEELQKYHYVPVSKTHITVEGCVPNIYKVGDQIAYLSFQLETGHWVHHAPFLVYSGNYDVLIGSNLIRGYRWSNCWKNQDCYIDLGNNEPLVPIHYGGRDTFKTAAASINEITIMPQETQILEIGMPHMDRFSKNSFKKHNLEITPLIDKDEEMEDGNKGLVIHPSLSKMKRGRLCVAASNFGKFPLTINKGQHLAFVNTVDHDDSIEHVNDHLQTKKIYDLIPRLVTQECHCCQTSKAEQNETVVQIMIVNKWGFGPIGSVLSPSKPLEMNNGVHILKINPKEQQENKKLYSILLVTDDEGGIGSITKREIIETKNRLKTLLEEKKLKPLFYFLDPLSNVSLTTRQVLVDLWKEMPFSFFPIQRKDGHDLCVRPSLIMNEPELLTGIDEAKIHFQIGPAPPLESMLYKDKESILKKIEMKDALLIMFRNQNIINFHLHMPLLNKRQRSLTEVSRKFYAKWLFTELRQLRIPLHIELTVDGLNAMTGCPVDANYYKDQIFDVLKDSLLFPEPSARTFWPQRLDENPPENVSYLYSKCRCSLCTRTNFSAVPGIVKIFKGNINELITKAIVKKSESIFSTNSRVSASLKAFIETISDEYNEIDTDVPLDPLELRSEEDMQNFLSTLPGQEQDKEIDQLDESKLPPIQKSDPALFGNHPMDGIPDQFRPGNWRNTDMMDRIPSEVPDHIKQSFGDLLDKYSNLFSYYPDNCRPLSLNGKPVILDIELVSDIPVFMKPYTCFGSQIDMLDNKITDLLIKNEIHRIKSDYNIAVILTHHNSSQKHVQGAEKKVRMCLDLRIINMLTKNKNIDSHLVTGIEQKKTVLKGNPVLSSADISKAYRAIMASERLQQITAFRCPSSRKYPNDTFAFKSAADGLACMPGLYSRVLQEALSPEARHNCISHIDDILIYSKTYEDHLHHLDIVFRDLMKCNFLLSASKFQPFQKEIYFLGFMISGDEQWIPEDRLSFVDKIEVPKNKKQIQSLLGTANYLSAFIDGFQQCCGPLYDAMKGKSDKTPLQLNDVQMKAFHELKRLIKNAPRLSHLDTSQPIYMECDASLTGAGSILYHIYDNPDGSQTKKVVRYGSRRWSLTESLNHTSLEREALAILVGAKTHMLFLQACPEVIIKTDLKSLIPILSCYNNPDSNTMAITSHRIYALPFKWKLHHTPGVSLPVADLFSRIHKPYECQYTDRRFRYPDLKREHIKMPEEWKQNPDLILTTADLMEAMRQQIMFIEKSSYNVKEKRLKGLLDEVILLFDDLGNDRDVLLSTVKNDLKEVRQKTKKVAGAEIEEKHIKLTNPPQKTLITPEFLIKGQNSNPKLHNILLLLRTKQKSEIPKKILKNYRILNDTFLITRITKTKPFDHPGNIRIVCDAKMTIHILATIHVSNCHYGQNLLNHVFQQTYKCIEGSTQAYVKLVCTGCRSCQFIRATNKKVVKRGRIPFPTSPNSCWCVDFMVFEKDQTHEGKKIAACFNILDLYSGYVISHLVKDQTSRTVIDCLKRTFAQFNSPIRILSDNATAILKSPEVIHFLRSNNVRQLTTITSHNSRANKVERFHKLLRESLLLVKETFKRSSQFDLFYNVIRMLNNRPLTIALHPNVKTICKESNTTPGIVTPYSLYFGVPPDSDSKILLQDSLPEKDQEPFNEKWKRIITQHDKLLQEEHDKQQPENEEAPFDKGDLVLISNEVRHKEQVRYYKEIFEIVKIEKAKYYCEPLFKTTGLKHQFFEVNGNRLKRYNYSKLFDILPSKLRMLMGENLSPEQLKEQALQTPGKLPSDLQDWRHWRPHNVIKLRNRIMPSDDRSEPALSVINSDTLSSSSGSTTLSIPDSIPDNLSHISSVLSNCCPPQLHTTDTLLKIVNPMQIPNVEKTMKKDTPNIATDPVSDRRLSANKKLQNITDNANINRNQSVQNSADNTTVSQRTPIGNIPVARRLTFNSTANDNSTIQHDVSQNTRNVTNISTNTNDSILGVSSIADNLVSPPVNQPTQKTPTPVKPKNDVVQSVLGLGRRLRDRAKINKPDRYGFRK
jgi:hypothetical protein